MASEFFSVCYFAFLFQLSEALAFLHCSAKMIHGNVCPESVIVSKNGAWKIAGFDFCITRSGSGTDVSFQKVAFCEVCCNIRNFRLVF